MNVENSAVQFNFEFPFGKLADIRVRESARIAQLLNLKIYSLYNFKGRLN